MAWSDEAREAAAAARGAHSGGITARVPDKYAVRLHAAYFGRTAAGQINTRIGNVWANAAKPGRSRARAESIARGLRVDNPDRIVKITR